MNLEDILTDELVKELEARKGVQTFQDRPYQAGYNINITHKYSEDRTPIELPVNKTVLVIENTLLNIEDNTEENTEVIWRRFELIDKAKEGELIELLNRKNLFQEDLILIFQTLRANEVYFKSLAKKIKKIKKA